MSINYSILEHAVKYRTMFNITLNPCIKVTFYHLIMIRQLYCLCRTSRTSEMSGFDTSVPHFPGIHSLHGGGIRDIESVMYRRLIAVRILIGVVPSLKIAH